MLLKYLFHCQFNDGAIFSQDADDRSVIDPDKRSSFFDLLQDTRKVERFWLLETYKNVDLDRITPSKYLVDLTDGHFEINGSSFFLHEQSINVDLTNFRLIYFRRRQESLNLATGETGSKVIFVMGWQANHPDGKNEKKLLFIK